MQTKFSNIIYNSNKIKKETPSTKRLRKNTIDIKSISKFDFEKGLISKNDEENQFVNFLKYNDEQGYKIVEEYYLRYLYGDYSFLDEFELDELTRGDRVERLLSIIKNVHKIKYTNRDVPHIIKLKSVKDKRLHFFIKKSRNNLTLILIDIYHLGIYGTHYINGKPQKTSIRKIYRRYKDNKIDLADFKKEGDSELETIGN